MEKQDTLFEKKDAQQVFANQYKALIEAIPDITRASEVVVNEMPATSFESKLMFALAKMVFEDDFTSILLLSANGLSTGAMQILRGMFERYVTLTFIGIDPEKAKLFWEFYWVDLNKATEAFERAFPGKMDREKLEGIRAKFNQVKENYEITDCKRCGTKRLNISWSKTNLVDMAKKVGLTHSLIRVGYYQPIGETHAKVEAILRRLESKQGIGLQYRQTPNPVEERETLLMAHYLALSALTNLTGIFEVEALEEPLEKCWKDFQRIWNLNLDENSRTLEVERPEG